MKTISALLLVCVLLLTSAASTDAREWRSWCGADASRPLGWHFYCDRDEPEEEAPRTGQTPPESAQKRIQTMRKALEDVRAKAIIEPTPGNVTAYLRLQQRVLQSAAAFSDAFRRAVWANPDLDYTLRRPVGALAKRLWTEERRAERDAALARLGERYGLIYLGSDKCPACRVFGPLLRAFALRHGLEVLAVSTTGGSLEGWPEAVADRGRAARLGIRASVLPALILYDAKTKRAVPVSYGVVAEDQIADRIFALTAREVGSDY
ncbi:MAG: conjugal transfer protein TraF [Nitrospinae bacterium]|nr:conjugal transfer protein TraF [Nitrospinota bacterium]